MNDTVVNVFKGQVNEATALAKLLEVSTIVVQQAVDLVDGSLTSDEQLTVQSRYMPGSTIGTWCTVYVGYFSLQYRQTSAPRERPFRSPTGLPVLVLPTRPQL